MNYTLTESLRSDIIAIIVEDGSIDDYTETLCEFDPADAQQWVSAMIRLIFESLGNSNFISSDATIRAGQRIIRRYGKMKVCDFARFVNQWECGEYGHQAVNIQVIMENLKIYYLNKVAGKMSIDDYNAGLKIKLLNRMREDREVLYGDVSKKEVHEAVNKAYKRMMNGTHTKDDVYLLANYSDGVIPATEWDKIERGYERWKKEKIKKI